MKLVASLSVGTYFVYHHDRSGRFEEILIWLHTINNGAINTSVSFDYNNEFAMLKG